MGALIVSEEIVREAQRVREFAERPENLYRPGKSGVPGDDPRHVFTTGTYRVVFSWTESEGRAHRHVSVSAMSGKFPAPIAAFTIAYLLGFTGVEPDAHGFVHNRGPRWIIAKDPVFPAIVIAEPVLSS